jgi:hypothetical protein
MKHLEVGLFLICVFSCVRMGNLTDVVFW